MSKLILVPVDGSTHARQAIEFAVDWAQGRDAQLHLIHVPEMPSASDLAFAERYSVDLSKTRTHLETLGQDIIAKSKEIAKSLGGEVTEGYVAIGNPAKQIVQRAEELKADMIVMGTRGNSDWKNLLLGSVSHKVMQMAPCTTVIVR